MDNTTDLINRTRRSWRAQTLKNAVDFVHLTADFQQISSSYMIIYFCNEDWLECSGATVITPHLDVEVFWSLTFSDIAYQVLHSDCLWSIVSQDHLRHHREKHYILSTSMTTESCLACVERAALGIWKGLFYHPLSTYFFPFLSSSTLLPSFLCFLLI